MYNLDNYSVEYYQNIVNDNIRCYDSLWCVDGSLWCNSASFLVKLAKIVAAMANCDGGELIYGISQKRSHAEAFSTVRNFDKTADWLLHEIQSQIEPQVKDLRVLVCEIPDHDGCVIHIHVPSNNNAPHLFADSKFYRWQKGKCLVMSEKEIRTAYTRLNVCDVEFLGVSNINGIPTLAGGKFQSMSFYPKFMIRNAGNIVEHEYKVEIAFPSALFEESNQPLKNAFVRHEGIYSVFGQKGNYPIFQQEICTIIEAKITVNAENISTFLSENLMVYLYFSNGINCLLRSLYSAASLNCLFVYAVCKLRRSYRIYSLSSLGKIITNHRLRVIT
ncbi:MAG: ATP-binding protein [Bacteroidales bacterium]|nr:ATP-binding protein [Bacteroidales bacterium]